MRRALGANPSVFGRLSRSAEERDPFVDETVAALTRARRRAAARALAFVVGGAVLSAIVQSSVGCATGTCVLWATPERAAAYGGVIGLVVAML